MQFKKIFDNIIWIAIDYIGFQFINLIIQIFLARLLSPSDFGVLSIIVVFLAIFNVFFEQGIVNSMVINKIKSEDQLSSFYWISLFLGIIFTICLIILSYPIAVLLNNNHLIAPLQVISLCLISNSMLVVYKYLLLKDLKFKLQARITMFSALISGIIGIYFAYIGYGYWSLIIKTLIMNILLFLLMSITSTWKPKMHFNFLDIRMHIKTIIHIVSIAILEVLNSYALNIAIGKQYTIHQLGYYTNAQKFTQIFSNLIILLTNKMSLAKLPLLTNYKKQQIINNVTVIYTAILIPISFLLLYLSPKLIYYVLGEQWLKSDKYFKVFILISFLNILVKNFVTLTEVINETKFLLKIEVSYKFFSLGGALLLVIMKINLINVLIFLLLSNLIYLIFFLQKYCFIESIKKIIIMMIFFFISSLTYFKFYYDKSFLLDIKYLPLVYFTIFLIIINILQIKNLIFKSGEKYE